MVLAMAVTVVRPWSLAHGNAMTAMTLPWLAVPFMFAINAHGFRAAAGRAETLGDGSQPAGRLRSAVSCAQRHPGRKPPSIAIPIVKDGKNIRCEIMPNGAVLTIDDSRYSVQRLAPGSNS